MLTIPPSAHFGWALKGKGEEGGSTMLTIPPSAHFDWALREKGGEEAPANHELSHQDIDTHFFIVVNKVIQAIRGPERPVLV